MRIVRIDVEPMEKASERRRNLVELLQRKKEELNWQQPPSGLTFFEALGTLDIDLSRAMGTVEQERRLILFERFPISLRPKVSKLKITGVDS